MNKESKNSHEKSGTKIMFQISIESSKFKIPHTERERERDTLTNATLLVQWFQLKDGICE